jgi:hypothetical protein
LADLRQAFHGSDFVSKSNNHEYPFTIRPLTKDEAAAI